MRPYGNLDPGRGPVFKFTVHIVFLLNTTTLVSVYCLLSSIFLDNSDIYHYIFVVLSNNDHCFL